MNDIIEQGDGAQKLYTFSSEFSGHPFQLNISGVEENKAPFVMETIVKFLARSNEMFSIENEKSPLMALRKGTLDEDEVPPAFVSLIQEAVSLREETGGLFNPWRSSSGVVFYGFLKGWVARNVQNRCQTSGNWDVKVTVGNVVSASGLNNGHPWDVMLPEFPQLNLVEGTVRIGDPGHEALSWRTPGSMGINPFSGEKYPPTRGVIVSGPNSIYTDTFAGCVMAEGAKGAEWLLARFPNYSILLGEASNEVPIVEGYGSLLRTIRPLVAV